MPVSGRQRSRESGRRPLLTVPLFVVSFTVSLLASLAAVGLANPASGATGSVSTSLSTQLGQNCPSTAEVKSITGGIVSLVKAGGIALPQFGTTTGDQGAATGFCTYTRTCRGCVSGKDFTGISLSVSGGTLSNFEKCTFVLIGYSSPCVPQAFVKTVTGVGAVARTAEYKGGFFFAALEGNTALELQFSWRFASVRESKALAKAFLPKLVPGANIPTAGLSCTSDCAFAVGNGNVVLSWPDSGSSEYDIPVYFNGVPGLSGLVLMSQMPVTLAAGQVYWELTPSEGWCINESFRCGVGTSVSFEYATYSSSGEGPLSAMSNSVVVK
jgi:hypothetical protein